ncbi:hypothetical protein KAR48_00110 [bacterium]|nr:hypothetical protein [bacterium]
MSHTKQRIFAVVHDEKGVFAAFYLIFVLLLGFMGIGAFRLIKSEGNIATENIVSIRVNYAAAGGAYYGISRLAIGALDEGCALDIDGVIVQLDTSSSNTEISLVVSATQNSIQNQLNITMRSRAITDYAAYLDGSATNISSRDSTGVDAPELILENIPDMPGIDQASLAALSTAQGNNQIDATFTPADGYGGSFFQADGITPTVHHVSGNLDLQSARTIYGIFVVDGSITIAGSARVTGIIYATNSSVTMILGGGSPTGATIDGGVVSAGNMFGTGSNIYVNHVPVYMRAFAQFVDPVTGFMVMSWNHI